MQATNTLLWFVDNNSTIAARQVLEAAGVRVETTYSQRDRVPYSEGILQKEKNAVRIILFPTTSATSPEAQELAKVANHLFLTGGLAGRPGQVKLGDVVAVAGCYHIDLGADRKMDGAVIHNFSPLFATAEVQATLRKLQFEQLQLEETLPVALHTRRNWVLDYLMHAEKALPMQELFRIATDETADGETKNLQWKKTVLFLREMGFLTVENRQVELTEKGREHCGKYPPETYEAPTNQIRVKLANIITSSHTHAELEGSEDWIKFDKGEFSPLGLDTDSYDMLRLYPKITILKAVSNFGAGDKGDKKDVIQKAAAVACMHLIQGI